MDKDIINILEKLFISQQSLTSEEQRIFDEWMKEAGKDRKSTRLNSSHNA